MNNQKFPKNYEKWNPCSLILGLTSANLELLRAGPQISLQILSKFKQINNLYSPWKPMIFLWSSDDFKGNKKLIHLNLHSIRSKIWLRSLRTLIGLESPKLFLMFYLSINPFVPNVPFLYPPKNIRKPYGFLIFSRGRERMHLEQMG